MEELVKSMCHVSGTVNNCSVNCLISVHHLVNHSKNNFLVTFAFLDLTVTVLRLGSGKVVSNIQSSRLKHFIANRHASSNPKAFT